MRPSTRLFATVKSAARYLEANTPTGLTGLQTHPSPRPALIYTYRRTLDKLAQMPQGSVYRQSTEALTKHRLAIIEAVIPDGHEAWLERVKKQIEATPDAYKKLQNPDGTLAHEELYAEPIDVWDGKIKRGQQKQEGSNTKADAEAKGRELQAEVEKVDKAAIDGELPLVKDLEVEPPLTADQYVFDYISICVNVANCAQNQ